MKPRKNPLARKLKAWRGKRYQKEAADFLRVPLRTYQTWESGRRVPAKMCLQCLEKAILTPIP